jgi:photosystem II stability/assembly factor-like uncharacterized protein
MRCAKDAKFIQKIIYIMLFFAATVSADWIPQNSGVIKTLNAVKFIDNSIGIVVGKTGVILRTVDSGDQWSRVISGTSNDLNGVFFINKTTGWICGDGGTILKTVDAGAHWTPQPSGTSLNLESIYFYNASLGWAVGDAQRIVTTDNGGAAWTIESYSPYDASVVFRSVHFIGPNSGWIVGDAAHIVRETSSTSGWFSSKINSISDFTRFNKVFFINQTTGWIVGRKASLVFSKLEILKTRNGGASWQITYPDPNVDMGLEALYDIQFINESLGWSVGQDGKIIHSSDGGNSWNLQVSDVLTTLNSISFVDDSNGWIVGSNGLILHTTNGGKTGAAVSSGKAQNVTDFLLKQNYPNPFNSSTIIEFELAQSTTINVSVYSMAGKHIATLANGSFIPGLQQIQFEANGLASGVYLCKLSTDRSVYVKRMLLLQ